jgi:putative polyketide hydroxylase
VYFRAPYGERLAGRRALLANVLGEQLFEVFVAVDGDDHWLMHHFLDEGESAADCTPERMAEQVRRASGMPEVAIEVLSVSPWVMTPSLATRWRQGRCLLVGDAAARVSPSGGLGMNNGVQGAHNLAWKLAAVVHGQAPEELLDSYEQERLAASEFTFANSEGNAEEIFAIVGAALAGDWEQASQRIARSRRAGAGYGQDFGIVYGSHAAQPDGSEELKPLDVVNDYIPQARPGHRAPHAWITRGAGRVSTLDCFGGGFVALAAAGADRELLQTWAPGVEVLVEGRDFQDPAGEWRRLYGLGETGAVLVRPDGYVAARR